MKGIEVKKQDIFDKSVTHMMRQGRPAVFANGNCRYRMADNDGVPLMCAIGCLIPDHVYRPQMEGLDVTQLNLSFHWVAVELGDNLKLAWSLQDVHDFTDVPDCEEPGGWRKAIYPKLQEVARTFRVNQKALRAVYAKYGIDI